MAINEQLKYPIGKFDYVKEADIESYIRELEEFPVKLKNAVEDLGEKELNWRYRPEGRKLFQVIHHVADSHINAYTRMKVAYSESGKSITPYEESKWALLPDVQTLDLNDSVSIIFLIHKRLVTVLKSLTPKDWEKTYFHPADNVAVSLHEAAQMYAWHGNHHLAHIRQGLESKGIY